MLSGLYARLGTIPGYLLSDIRSPCFGSDDAWKTLPQFHSRCTPQVC